jgi:RNA polymerase-binding transcription factor DksA
MDDEASSVTAALGRHRSVVEDRIAGLTRELDEIIDSAQLANVDDEHDPDGSTIAYERAKVIALLDAARQELAAIDVAQRRAAHDTYGTCATCGGAIGDERLEALPATTTCVICAAG